LCNRTGISLAKSAEREIICDTGPDEKRGQPLLRTIHESETEMARGSELDELVRGFSLLSAPTRLAILKALVAGPRNVTALCRVVGQKQPTMSHHLGLLRMGRLVKGTRAGKSVLYAVDSAAMKTLAAGIKKLTRK
jgi:DNA-binding transcriptional ArsR family regulator